VKADHLYELAAQYFFKSLIINIMKKYTIISAVMTLAIVCTFVVIGSTYANGLDNNRQGPKFKMTEEMKVLREKIDAAIESGDYETWKSLISELPGDRKMPMTEEAFAKMIENYKNRAVMEKAQQKIKEAIANNDYETWKSLVGELPNGADLLEKITADNFARFAEAHQLMEEARVKMEEAKTIMEELGLPAHQESPPFGEGMDKGPKNFGQWRSRQNHIDQ
jgi:hypothetical protein